MRHLIPVLITLILMSIGLYLANALERSNVRLSKATESLSKAQKRIKEQDSVITCYRELFETYPVSQPTWEDSISRIITSIPGYSDPLTNETQHNKPKKKVQRKAYEGVWLPRQNMIPPMPLVDTSGLQKDIDEWNNAGQMIDTNDHEYQRLMNALRAYEDSLKRVDRKIDSLSNMREI